MNIHLQHVFLTQFLCKPIVFSSCQQFLKFEIYKFKLTTHSAYIIFSQPWESHEVWLFHMVDSGLCHGLTHLPMPRTIYLKSELQSSKHLVILDAYNFSLLQQSLKHFQNYRIQILLAFNHINITKTHLLRMNHYHTKIARYSHIIYAN